MDTSFIQKLRMNGIFGNDANGLGFPTYSNDQDFPTLLNTAYSMITQEKEKDRQFQREMYNRQQQGYLQDIARQAREAPDKKPMDVIYKPSISEYQKATLGLKGQELAQRGELGQEKIDVSKTGMNINQQKANILDFKSKNPGLKTLMTKGGNVMLYNPITGETHDTGVSTGTLNEQDKLDLMSEHTMEQIGARGDIQKEVQGTKGEQNLSAIAAKVAGQKEVQAEKPVKPESATQDRVKQNNLARQLANSRPDLAQHIKFDPSGNFTVTPPPTSYFGSGPTQEQYNEITSHIYGKGDITLKPEAKKKEPAKEAPKSKYKVTVQ